MFSRLFASIFCGAKFLFNFVIVFIGKMCKEDLKLFKSKCNNFYTDVLVLNLIKSVIEWLPQEKKLSRACDFLHTDRDINDETRSKLAFLNMSQRKRKSRSNKYMDDKYGNEINSTGSFLSDLSVTQSEEDFLEVSKPFKKHRPSSSAVNTSYLEAKQKRRSARRSVDYRSKSMFLIQFFSYVFYLFNLLSILEFSTCSKHQLHSKYLYF